MFQRGDVEYRREVQRSVVRFRQSERAPGREDVQTLLRLTTTMVQTLSSLVRDSTAVLVIVGVDGVLMTGWSPSVRPIKLRFKSKLIP